MSLQFVLLFTLFACVLSSGHLDVLYRWRTVDFEFPSHAARENAIRNKEYIPGPKIVPLDVDVWHNVTYKQTNLEVVKTEHNSITIMTDFSSPIIVLAITPLEPNFWARKEQFFFPLTFSRSPVQFVNHDGDDVSMFVNDKMNWTSGKDNDRTIFVTFPKFQKGIPATLATVSDRKDGDSHLLQAYPDWSWHSQTNCEGLMSVFRTQIDKCGRLWVIDSGMVDLSLESSRRQCDPKLLAFHLTNKRLAGKHIFPTNLLKENSILTNIAIDVRDAHNECQDTFAYVSDTTGYSLLVFDARRDKSWKVVSNSMYPYPPYGFFQTNSVEFNLMDGILGMALTPIERGERTLYYHSLASVRESWVPVSVLKNERHFTPMANNAFKEFKTSEEARRVQSVVQAFDRNGNLYFGMTDNSLNCWNHRKPFVRENIHEITRDNVNLQFASGLKIILNEDDEEEIWILTSRFQLAMVDQMSSSDVNFRIIRGKVEELTRSTKCGANAPITFPNRTKTNTHKPYLRPGSSGYGRFALN